MITGWNARFAHILKGKIRGILMLGNRPAPVFFKRTLEIMTDRIVLKNLIKIQDNVKFTRLFFGDEFFVRYVPQSRYFQSQELDVSGDFLDESELYELNTTKQITKEMVVAI